MTYLGCILDKTVSREPMAHKVISKVNARLQFLHQKNKYLTSNLCCNALIQPHFDYACSAWYPNLSKKQFKLYKINALVSLYSQIKCCIYLKKNLKQVIGSGLKKDIFSV